MRKQTRNIIYISLIGFITLFFSPVVTTIKATNSHTDYQVTILANEPLPDQSVPEADIKENEQTVSKDQNPLPKTGLPADLYGLNIGIILIIIGILLSINSQERNDRYEVL